MSNSFVKLVRKTVGIKGSSQHNGRGCWEMSFETDSWEKIKKGTEKLIAELTKRNQLMSTRTFKKFHEGHNKEYEFIEVRGSYEAYDAYSLFLVNECYLSGGVHFTLNPKEYPDAPGNK